MNNPQNNELFDDELIFSMHDGEEERFSDIIIINIK
jgi:hypothetical protein